MLRLGVLFLIWATKQNFISALDEFCVKETCSRDPFGSISVNCNECICSEEATLLGCTRKACEPFLCEPGASYDTDDGYFCCCDLDGYTEYCTISPTFVVDDETIFYEEEPILTRLISQDYEPSYILKPEPKDNSGDLINAYKLLKQHQTPPNLDPYKDLINPRGPIMPDVAPNPIPTKPVIHPKPSTTPDGESLVYKTTEATTTTTRTTTTQKPTKPTTKVVPPQYPDDCLAFVCKDNASYMTKNNCELCLCDQPEKCKQQKDQTCNDDTCSKSDIIYSKHAKICCCGQDGKTKYCSLA